MIARKRRIQRIAPAPENDLRRPGLSVARSDEQETEYRAEALSPREAAGDHVFCGLRLSDGVDLAEGSLRWGVDIGREFAAEIESLRCDGLVELDGTVLRATDAGYRVLDRVAAEFC